MWSISYTLLSVLVGRVLARVFKLPSWVAPAIAFNNTTSLPLLLIDSLRQAQILDSIILDGDSAADAMDRAESYFLINAMVSNSLTFALGPRLLKPGDEDAPSHDLDHGNNDDDVEEETHDESDGDIERGPEGIINEQTSLLPQRIVRPTNRVEKKGYLQMQNWFQGLPGWAQNVLEVSWQFANAPLLGALVGAIIGLTPALHHLFFNTTNKGGYFNAWLTVSIKNIGDLFAASQIIVVGVKLSQSMLHMKHGEDSGEVSKGSVALVTLFRFIIWPLYAIPHSPSIALKLTTIRISIPLIWAIASKTTLLSGDPMLWFTMMLMPTGPPAMMLAALTDVAGAPEQLRMTIAKFLTVRISRKMGGSQLYPNVLTDQLRCYSIDLFCCGRSVEDYRSCAC